MTMFKAILILCLILFLILTILGLLRLLLYGIKRMFFQPDREQRRAQEEASWRREKGRQGEADTVKMAAGILPDARILTNVYLPCKKGYTEVDIIILAVQAVYVIGNKNYSGWIYGNENDLYWTEAFVNKKYPLYNPVKQNEMHVFCLKKLFMQYGFSGRGIKSIVCFNDQAILKNVVSRTPVILTKDLKHCIDRKERNYTREEVEHMYRALKPFAEKNDRIRKDHIKRIKKKYGSP